MKQTKARNTILIFLCSVAAMTSQMALAQETVAWGIVEPASTNPALTALVTFKNEGKTQLAEEGIKRRDPSDIIRVGETYYVWYTKILEETEGYPGGWGDTIWYATSPDGITWNEQSQALAPASNTEAWDSHGVYTPPESSINKMETDVNTYQQDLAFLQRHVDVIELQHPGGDARLSLVPAWQGRVMTSSVSADGNSYGWLNYKLIKAGVRPSEQRQGLEAHVYVFGGEERF